MREKVLLIVLITCFSLSGCVSPRSEPPVTINDWTLPPSPEIQKLSKGFQETTNGYFITVQDAEVLESNVAELKSHIKKLEALVNAMKKYYKR